MFRRSDDEAMAALFNWDPAWDDGDEDLVRVMEEEEQRGAGHVFDLLLTPHTHHRVGNLVVRRRLFEARLQFNPEVVRPDDYNVSGEVEAALQRALEADEGWMADEDSVLFLVRHPSLTDDYQPVNIPVHELRGRSNRANKLLQTLAEKLNSTERFNRSAGLQVVLTITSIIIMMVILSISTMWFFI